MPHRASPLVAVALDGSRLWPLCGAEDGEVQHAAAEADSILDLLQLRLRKLRASAGEDVLMADCMVELAMRLYGRAHYGEAEELYRDCLRICLDLSFPELRHVFFRFLMKGTAAAVLLLRCFYMFGPQSNQSCIKVAFIWLPEQVMANALKTPKCIDFYI